MTCIPSDPRFRLLDHLVGWEAADYTGLTGLGSAEGVHLDGGPDGLISAAIDPYIPPPQVASGCNPRDWYLATKSAPQSHLKQLDGCTNDWHLVWRKSCVPIEFQRLTAVAVDRHRIALADAGTDRIWVLLTGAQILAEASVTQPRDLSFGPSGELVVAAEDGTALLCFTANLRPLGAWSRPLSAGRIARVAHSPDGRLWLVVEAATSGHYLLYATTKGGKEFQPATQGDLTAAFPATALVRSDDNGFCLLRGGGDGTEITCCYDWFGRPIAAECVSSASFVAYVRQGQLMTGPIDSGEPRCRWHRVRIDADIPAGSTVSLAITSSETATPAPQGVNDPTWAAFPAGLPHPDDWQVLEPGLTDTLIRQPAGRYLFLRLRLEGDGTATPHVRRVHIDFPRATGADLLPSIYREDAAAGDFTERFMALFDASLETVDATVRRFPALLGAETAHPDVLPWIAKFLSATLDEAWDAETRRRMLKAAPDLFRRRGTREGLSRTVSLAYGLADPPAIVEHGFERAWGAVASSSQTLPASARLGHTRLYSRADARMTLGTSPLGRAPIVSYGDQTADPHSTGAFRFSLSLPAGTPGSAVSLSRLVEGQKPAHTLASLRSGESRGFILGAALQLGIDTLISRPRQMALGVPDLRLTRGAVLGAQSAPSGPVLGAARLTSPTPSHAPRTCTE